VDAARQAPGVPQVATCGAARVRPRGPLIQFCVEEDDSARRICSALSLFMAMMRANS